MSAWEAAGKSDDWYTPKYIFDALGCRFDLDVAGPERGGHVPATATLFGGCGLEREWRGFIWCNAPFGKRNGLEPWLDKFFDHGDGIALVPDRTQRAMVSTVGQAREWPAVHFAQSEIRTPRRNARQVAGMRDRSYVGWISRSRGVDPGNVARLRGAAESYTGRGDSHTTLQCR